MADSEDLVLSITYETATALANAQILTDAILRNSEAFERLDAASSGTAASVTGTGTAAAAAGTSAAVAAVQVGQLGTALQQAGQTAQAAGGQIGNVSSQTQGAGTAAAAAGDAVDKWLSRYLTLQSIIAIFDTFIARLKEANDAEKALADNRSNELQSNRPIVRTFRVTESAAEQMVQNLTTAAPVSREQARASLLAAGEGGLDPSRRGSGGEKYATELAKAAGTFDLDQASLSKLARADVAAGGGTAASLDALIAKVAAAKPAGADPAKFMAAAIGSVLPDISRGGDVTGDLAVFATLAERGRDANAAAQAVKQLRSLTERGSNKADAYFAGKAAELGVTAPAAVTDAEAERLVDAQGDKGAERIADRRQRLDQSEASATLAERRLTADRERARRAKPADRASAEIRIESEEQRIAGERQRIDRERRDLADAVAKFRADETARRQAAAYEQLSADRKLQDVIVPTVAAATTPERQRELSSIVNVRSGDSLFDLAADGGRRLTRARAAVAGATGADVQRQYDDFATTDAAQDKQAAARLTGQMVSETTAGDSYQARLLREAVGRRMTEAAHGGVSFTDAEAGIKSLAVNKDLGVTLQFASALQRDIDRLKADRSLNPKQRVALDQVVEPFEQDFQPGIAKGVSAFADADLAQLEADAEAFGNFQADLRDQRRRQASGAAPPLVAPATKPAGATAGPTDGRDATAQASGGAGDTNYHSNETTNHYHTETHYHNSVGAYYASPYGDDGPPGPLEQAGWH